MLLWKEHRVFLPVLCIHGVALPERNCKRIYVELLGLSGGFPSLLVAEQAAGTAPPLMIHHDQAKADPALPGL